MRNSLHHLDLEQSNHFLLDSKIWWKYCDNGISGVRVLASFCQRIIPPLVSRQPLRV